MNEAVRAYSYLRFQPWYSTSPQRSLLAQKNDAGRMQALVEDGR